MGDGGGGFKPARDQEGHQAEPKGSVKHPTDLYEDLSTQPFTLPPPLRRWHLSRSMQIRRRPGGPLEIRDGGGVGGYPGVIAVDLPLVPLGTPRQLFAHILWVNPSSSLQAEINSFFVLCLAALAKVKKHNSG